jgi:hypothetical protein
VKKKKTSRVREWWVFDTEDDSQGHVYWVNFFNGTEHVPFSDPHRAIEWILDQDGLFWAVNLEYDLINLFGPLMDLLCVLTYGGFGLLKASVYGKPISFLNTLRHWPMSVEEMGQRLGYPKLPFDPTSLAYCQRDCEVTYKFIQSMMEKYALMGMEEVRATLPSTALKFYLTNFCKVRWQREGDLSIWKFLSLARYGGRCEIFYTKPVRARVYEYDLISSYPAAMRSQVFPNLDTIQTGRKSASFEREGVACCTVTCPSMEFPLLPYKSESGGKLLFPTGTFTGFWTYPEIRKALEIGYRMERVHRCIEYDAMASPFRRYIDFLHSWRQRVKKTDELMSYTLKIAMNSTFGKFGEEGELQVISRGVRYTLSQIPDHSNMVWAAYILAYGRLALYRCLQEASGLGQVLYCDTDSVFVKAARAPFPDSHELGGLAKKAVYQYAHFKLPKLYQVDASYKAKGVPLDKQRKADMEHLKREFFHDGIAEFLKPYRWLESKKLKEQPNVWREVTKQINARYDKRVVHRSGKTWPLHLGKAL